MHPAILYPRRNQIRPQMAGSDATSPIVRDRAGTDPPDAAGPPGGRVACLILRRWRVEILCGSSRQQMICGFQKRIVAFLVIGVALTTVSSAAAQVRAGLPRTADGRPDLQGIWQVRNRSAYDLEDHAARHGMPAGRSVVEGGTIPYQPWAAAKKLDNFANRATADPLAECYMPGVPRIMYMEFPFQIFQTRDHVAILFEWQQIYRLIYTNGSRPPEGIPFWMGDSRGRWEGDSLIVDVTNHNDRTWLDMAGNFHSDALRVTERYTMVDADTLDYEATIEDAKVFTRPWKIRIPLHRQKDMARVLEYQCRAELEEARGDFEPEPRTWYRQAPSAAAGGQEVPRESQAPPVTIAQPAAAVRPGSGQALRPGSGQARVPNLNGFYQADAGGANWGFEPHNEPFTPGGRGVLVDLPTLPYQPWAVEEKRTRNLPERGYDDPTAHCFVGGVPRAIYVPSPFHILQTPTHVVILHERMSWRIIPLGSHAPLPDTIRLWMGDSVGRWDGDTLVVETRNLNGKAWLNEVGDVISYAATIVERFTPTESNTMRYEATVTDPVVYTRSWTIAMPLRRDPKGELLEVACLEDNQDLQHLKEIRDAARARGAASGGR